MKPKTLATLIVIVFLVAASATFLAYRTYYAPLMQTSIPADVTIDRNVRVAGINADPDGLHFGKPVLGGGAKRKVNVSNDKDYDVIIYILKDDSPIWQMVDSGSEQFILPANDAVTMEFILSVPDDAEPASYKGDVTIVARRLSPLYYMLN